MDYRFAVHGLKVQPRASFLLLSGDLGAVVTLKIGEAEINFFFDDVEQAKIFQEKNK